jgi:hypothetical protein
MFRKGLDFPKIELLESCKKWQKTFFYVKNTTAVDLINLPEYVERKTLQEQKKTESKSKDAPRKTHSA